MKSAFWLWVIALVITLASARYQRVTGPTWPVSGVAAIGGEQVAYHLERTHAGADAHRVSINARNQGTSGVLEWREVAGAGEWNRVSMTREGTALVADIPGHGRGGKVRYRVTLASGEGQVVLPGPDGAVLRFRDVVPPAVLIPHILAMFGAMLFSTRAGLESLRPAPRAEPLVQTTVLLLIVGGIVLGMLVAWYAFRTPWTGFPVGRDITDSKTLIALVGWIAALVALSRARPARVWVIGAAALTLAVFLIPHSAG
jgi:uncharacterized membrane protein